MSNTKTIGGSPNITSSYTAYYPVHVYNDSVSWVSGNEDVDGLTRVYVEDVTLAYRSGPGVAQIVKGSTTTDGGNWVGSGGTIRFQLYKNAAGNTYFGRNSGSSPSPIRNDRDGTTWNGTLCGTVKWSTVPEDPPTIAVGPHPTEALGARITYTYPGSTDDGGQPVTGFQLYQSLDGGATWDAVGAPVDDAVFEILLTDLTAETEYLFGVSAINVRGTSKRRVAAAAYIPTSPSNINRYGGASFEDRSVSRYDGAASDRAQLQRWDGSAWADTK